MSKNGKLCYTRPMSPRTALFLALVTTAAGCILGVTRVRRRLEREGEAFVSATDTEVVMAAYARWGSADRIAAIADKWLSRARPCAWGFD